MEKEVCTIVIDVADVDSRDKTGECEKCVGYGDLRSVTRKGA